MISMSGFTRWSVVAAFSFAVAAHAQTSPPAPATGAAQPAASQPSAGGAATLAGKPAEKPPAKPPINMPPMTGQPANPSWATPLKGERYLVEEPYYNFRDVWQNKPVMHEFIVKNTHATKSLMILDVTPECHCTVAGGYTKEIPPGGEGKIPFTLWTTGLGNNLVKRARVKTNDGMHAEFTLTLEGFVKTVLTMTPNSGGSFGEVIYEDQVVQHEMIVESNVPEPLTFALALPNGKTPWRVSTVTLELGRKWKVIVKTDPPLPAGFQNYTFRFSTGHPEIPTWPLLCTYYRPERISAKPINLRFPDVYTKNEPLPSVEVINNGQTKLKILSAAVPDDPSLTVRTVEVTPGRQFRIEVEPPVDYKLDGSLDLFVKTDDEQYKEIKIPIWSLASRGKDSAKKHKGGKVAVAASQSAAPATPAPRAPSAKPAQSPPPTAPARN